MQPSRTELLPGVFLTCLQTDKFKTGVLSINLLTRLSPETVTMNTLLPSVLRRGTMYHPDLDSLAAALDNLYGAHIEPVSRKKGEIHSIGFWADFIDDAYLPEDGVLEKTVDLLGEVLLSPNTRGGLLLPQYVSIERDKLLEDIAARINNKISYSRFRLIELMCLGEAYACDLNGTKEAAEAITHVTLTRQYRKLLAESPIEIFYCGTASEERITAALQRALECLPRGEIDYDIGTDIRMNSLDEKPREFVETMDVGQSNLAIGFRLGDCMEDPDLPALRVMNTIFGGGVSSKLFMNVREKLSLCYFASSGLDTTKGIMLVLSGIDAANRERAQEEIFRQLQDVQEGRITEDELACARASLISDLHAAGDSAGALESFWLGQNLLGLDYGPDELAALIEDVTVQRVVDCAKTVVCDMIYFLTGDEDECEEDGDE